MNCSPRRDATDTIVQLFKTHPSALITSCRRFNQTLYLGNIFEDDL
jgi:hypothetical protein